MKRTLMKRAEIRAVHGNTLTGQSMARDLRITDNKSAPAPQSSSPRKGGTPRAIRSRDLLTHARDQQCRRRPRDRSTARRKIGRAAEGAHAGCTEPARLERGTAEGALRAARGGWWRGLRAYVVKAAHDSTTGSRPKGRCVANKWAW